MTTLEDLKKQTDLPVVEINSNGNIQHVNEKFEECFGWTKEELLNKPILTIIPKNLHDAHNLGFSRFLTTEKPTLLGKPLKLKAVKKDGTVFNAEHHIIGEKKGDEWVFAASIKPL